MTRYDQTDHAAPINEGTKSRTVASGGQRRCRSSHGVRRVDPANLTSGSEMILGLTTANAEHEPRG